MKVYRRDGTPYPESDAGLREWEKDFEKNHVAKTHVGKVYVSTVWLGIDHGFGGKVLIFETMVFGGKHDQYQERYETEAEAKAGHKRVVQMVKTKGESK